MWILHFFARHGQKCPCETSNWTTMSIVVDKKTQHYDVMDSDVPCLREMDNSVLLGGQQCLYPYAAVCWRVALLTLAANGRLARCRRGLWLQKRQRPRCSQREAFWASKPSLQELPQVSWALISTVLIVIILF
jgi:hypothetical protein